VTSSSHADIRRVITMLWRTTQARRCSNCSVRSIFEVDNQIVLYRVNDKRRKARLHLDANHNKHSVTSYLCLPSSTESFLQPIALETLSSLAPSALDFLCQLGRRLMFAKHLSCFKDCLSSSSATSPSGA